MADILDMAYINSLPQPFLVRYCGDKDWWWPIHDICVETGLHRIDVCGKLQAKHIGEVAEFKDAEGVIHNPEDFYIDSERRERSAPDSTCSEGENRG